MKKENKRRVANVGMNTYALRSCYAIEIIENAASTEY